MNKDIIIIIADSLFNDGLVWGRNFVDKHRFESNICGEFMKVRVAFHEFVGVR